MGKLSTRKKTVLELRCEKNADGTFNGHIFEDGLASGDPDLIMRYVDCADIRELWVRGSQKYLQNPKVVGACEECFSVDWYGQQEIYPEGD